MNFEPSRERLRLKALRLKAVPRAAADFVRQLKIQPKILLFRMIWFYLQRAVTIVMGSATIPKSKVCVSRSLNKQVPLTKFMNDKMKARPCILTSPMWLCNSLNFKGPFISYVEIDVYFWIPLFRDESMDSKTVHLKMINAEFSNF